MVTGGGGGMGGGGEGDTECSGLASSATTGGFETCREGEAIGGGSARGAPAGGASGRCYWLGRESGAPPA